MTIKYIGWDVDGTLYNFDNFKFEGAIQDTRKKMAHIDWGWDNTDHGYASGYNELRKILDPESFESTMYMFTTKVMDKVSKDYIKEDNQLQEMFINLSGYNHFVITDGPEKHAKNVIEILGLKSDIFNPFITYEDFKLNDLTAKAFRSTSTFKYALDCLECEPTEVLYVGDRPTDMVAKRLGINTALAWQRKKISKNADYLAKSIYDVPAVIKKIDDTLLPRRRRNNNL